MSTFWRQWLLLALAGQIILGLGLAFFGTGAVFEPLNAAIDAAVWGGRDVPPEARLYQRFAYGVIGATTAGWGVTALLVAARGLVEGGRWPWTALAGGLALWFVVDVGISAWLGVTANVLFNFALAAALVPPLIALYHRPAADRPEAAASK